MRSMTVAEAFEQYLREVKEEALPKGVDRSVVERAFYVGAIKAIEIVSLQNRNMETMRAVIFDIVHEVRAWIYPGATKGSLS